MNNNLCKILPVAVLLSLFTEEANADMETNIECCDPIQGLMVVPITPSRKNLTQPANASWFAQKVLNQLTSVVPESMITTESFFYIEVFAQLGPFPVRSFPLIGHIKPGEKWKDIAPGIVVDALVASTNFGGGGGSIGTAAIDPLSGFGFGRSTSLCGARGATVYREPFKTVIVCGSNSNW
jgi:hypothetical protein